MGSRTQIRNLDKNINSVDAKIANLIQELANAKKEKKSYERAKSIIEIANRTALNTPPKKREPVQQV